MRRIPTVLAATLATGLIASVGVSTAQQVGSAILIPVTLAPGDAQDVTCSGDQLAVQQPDATHASLTCSSKQTTPSPTAASTFGWGSKVAGDEFNYTGVPDFTKWAVYDSAGHNGNGLRRPSAWEVNGSVAQVTGDTTGTTGGMSARFGHREYGRWETRMRTNVRDPKYHPVLLLWPDSGNWPCDGEIDYAEGATDTTVIGFYQHYSCSNSRTSSQRTIDTTQWHNYAVEWTPTHVTGFIDGVEWFTDTNAAHLPPGPMHQTIQLDWFPDGTASRESWMQVDWTRVYDLTSSSPTPTVSPPTVSPPTGGTSLDVAAVGDIHPPSSSSNSAGTANAASTSDFILGLGDYQYQSGDMSDYNAYFDKDWGRLVPKMYPVLAPTHDQSWTGDPVRYFNGGGASGYESPVNLSNHTSYSFDKGGWHFLAIDDSCYRDTVSCSTSALLLWVKSDLAAHPNKCTLAYWHQAYFTSTAEHSAYTAVEPVVQALYDAGVDVALQAHNHNYERFAPQTPDRVGDDAKGIRAFVVGTGGIGFYSFRDRAANSEARSDSSYGVLKMTLRDGGYDWRFQNTGGTAFTDTGTDTCH
jgi:hypothetical protein